LADELRRAGYVNDLWTFVRFGTRNLASNLSNAERNLQRSDGFGREAAQQAVNTARAAITRELAAIAQKRFYGEYTYSAGDERVDGNQSSFTMTIQTGFFPRMFNDRNVSFPMGGITFGPDGAARAGQHIVLRVSGSRNDIQDLFRNRSNYQVRVWFTNLRYNNNDNRIEADVQRVAIVRNQ
jgi:hypothetical protein